jgi:molybdenum cofactor cytidylyltransferase
VSRLLVGAVLLAAGTSSRMRGANKLLTELDGVPLVRRTALEVLASSASPVVVVLGHRNVEVAAALVGLDVQRVVNAEYRAGLATSLGAGIRALGDRLDGVVVCLGDMPFVRAADVDTLIGAFEASQGRDIVVPIHEGRRGNPVLWPRAYFHELQRLEGDTGARALLVAHAPRVRSVVVETPGVLIDLDTPEDVERGRRPLPFQCP